MTFEAPIPQYFAAALHKAGHGGERPLPEIIEEGIERLLHDEP